MADEDIQQIIPRSRVPINGGTTTRVFQYKQPSIDMKGIEFIFPWMRLWDYWLPTRYDSQLMMSQNKRHYTDLRWIFKAIRDDIAGAVSPNIYISMAFELDEKNGLEIVQTDGYISGESGPVYPVVGTWEWSEWGVPVWHRSIKPGIKIIK